jgi:dehydrogenase/reductase SDR family protein 12
MNMAQLKKIVRFYGRFLVSFSAIGYRARALRWGHTRRDFAGQTWVVTGATGGIGRAIAESAAAAGATVLAVARNPDKLAQLVAASGAAGRLVPVVADLALVADTRRAAADVAARVAAQGRPVDVLVNNVGVLLDDLGATAEGFETSYATNLLNHWVLTEALLERGALGARATVIEMSSGGMYNVPLTLPYMNMRDPAKYNGVYAYGVHKRGQAELVKYWHARHASGGRRFYVMHPGWADTEGVRTALPRFRKILKSVLRNDAQGADTALWLAATRPETATASEFWFDRAARAAHAFPHTAESPHTPADLAALLAEHAGRVPA